MKHGATRILTTHTGSLPRPADLLALLIAEQSGGGADRRALEDATRRAVTEVVRRQAAHGLDVISDGEQNRVDYTVYLKDRLTGFEGESTPPLGTGDEEFPELAAILRQFASPFQHRPACTAPVAWKDWPAVEADLERFKVATAGVAAEEFFMTAPSPGQLARFLHNRYYPDDETYLRALAGVMRRQYRAIVEAGFVLQVDCPDLALSRHTVFAHLSLPAFRRVIAMHVDVLNDAVRDLPPDRMRMHICWGSTLGPHHTDVPLADIVDVALEGRPAALSFPGANPRHEHEWKIWKDVKLPAGKIIIPGVIDSTSNFVEHPELVAERIARYASVVGREHVMAGVDCGFGTFAGRVQVDSKVEHHFNDYSFCPDNLQLMSYMAAVCPDVDLGTAAVILPWHDPLRVAEQVSVLDYLSKGRLRLGMGRGLARREFEAFRGTMDESRGRFDEAAEMIVRGLRTGVVEGNGTFYKQPRTEIRPRPRRSFDGRVYAVASSDDSVVSAAKLNARMVMFADRPWPMRMPAIRKHRELVRQMHGVDAAPPLLADFCVCTPSMDGAREQARQYMGKFVESNFYHYELLGEHFSTVKGYDAYAQKIAMAKEIGMDGIVSAFMEAGRVGSAGPHPPHVRGATLDRVRVRAGDVVSLRRHALRPGGVRAAALRQGCSACGEILEAGRQRTDPVTGGVGSPSWPTAGRPEKAMATVSHPAGLSATCRSTSPRRRRGVPLRLLPEQSFA